jgi:hypothetical protein
MMDAHATGTYQYANGVDSTYTTSNCWGAGQPDHAAGYKSGETEHYVHVYTDTMLLNDAPGQYYGFAVWKTAYPQPQIVGCCEAPAGPINTCPAGYTGLDASGYCYKGVATTGGYSWAGAAAACRSNSGFLAHITDATTAASVITNHCGGTIPASLSFWIGLQDLTAAAGHADKQADYWRWYGSGADNSFLRSGGMNAYWQGSQPDDYQGAEHCIHSWAAWGGLLNDAGCTGTTLDTVMSACCMAQGYYVMPTPSVTATPSVSPSSSVTASITPSGSLTCSQTRTSVRSGWTFPPVEGRPGGTTWVWTAGGVRERET